jgi:hypothetical protein
VGGQGRGDLNARGRQEGGGGGGKNTFLSWFHFFIRPHGKKFVNKSFFVSL